MNKNNKLKAYMGYSRSAGPEEGAILIFAHNAREAKLIGWNVLESIGICEEWIDIGINLIRNEPWLFEEANQEKLSADVSHVIDNPKICKNCEKWGESPIGPDGVCENCHTELEGYDQEEIDPNSKDFINLGRL